MEIIKLPTGELAPHESDCIHIDEIAGRFHLNTSALSACPSDPGEEIESAAVIGGQSYDSFDAAEAAGLAIAAEQCVEMVYVSHNKVAA